MNLAEGLAREIMRVTELRCHYQEIGRMPNVMVGFAVDSMTKALNDACVAAGSNDIVAVLRANEALKEFEK